jgi:hypothetical protein
VLIGVAVADVTAGVPVLEVPEDVGADDPDPKPVDEDPEDEGLEVNVAPPVCPVDDGPPFKVVLG